MLVVVRAADNLQFIWSETIKKKGSLSLGLEKSGKINETCNGQGEMAILCCMSGK